MKVIIRQTKREASIWAARHIVAAIKAKAAVTDKPFVLGLPTGSTPIDTYDELIRMYRNGEVSFKNVVTFNMDEYVGLPVEHPESYHSFMFKYLFDHIDINPKNIHILDGSWTETPPTWSPSAKTTRKPSKRPVESTSSWVVWAKTATWPSMSPSPR